MSFALLRSGAVGYLVKDSARDVLVGAIRAAHREDSVLAPRVAQRLVDALAKLATRGPESAAHPLSEREVDVLASFGSSSTMGENRRRSASSTVRGAS